MIRKVLVVALIWSTAFLLIPRTPQLVFAETTTTTTVASTTTVAATTTTAATTEKQLTGGTMALLQLSEQQLQMRFNYSISGSASGCMAQGPFTETWSISPSGGSWEQNSRSWTVGFCGNVNDSGLVFNVWGLSPGTTYTVSVSGGYPGNMVSGSRSITTNGSGWGSTTTSTISSGTSTSTSVSSGTTATTVFYNDPALYMARINSSNVVIDVCVCSESFVRENPSRYPGTWVPMWMGVNGKNYAGPGWIYNPVAENFYPPTTTTTSTTSPSSITIEPTATSSSLSSSSSSNFDSSTTTTAVPSGEVRASVGGVEVEAKTTVGKNAVTVSFGEVKAEISNKGATDNSTNTDTQQGLVLSSGESADVSIDGLQPNSEVEVVIYSTPRNLGSLQVNEFGELVASIEIPSNMESGSHTLVLKGLDKFGKQIELKFGLVVYSPDAYIPVWVWFLIGLLFILLSLSFISRRSTKA
jgi:hypothetical protein